jgi:hypothetical protein
MRPSFLLVPCLLPLACLACSPSSSPAGVHEAGTDATADASDESCFPFCGSSGSGSSSGGGGGDDGGDASCAQLKSQVEMLQAPAQACNPAQVNQCSGTVQGLCCPITVSAGNDQAANAFEQAVSSFTSQCDAGCLAPVCPTAPSLHCDKTQGTQGVCE